MAFEDFLRSVPLVHNHIIRTRRLMHENRKLREFVELNGVDSADILAKNGTIAKLIQKPIETSSDNCGATLESLAKSLRVEKNRFAELLAEQYILQIDYDNLLKRTLISDEKKCPHKP